MWRRVGAVLLLWGLWGSVPISLWCNGVAGGAEYALAATSASGTLPGKEITSEEMKKTFPAPLKGSAPHMGFVPEAAPLFAPTPPVPVLPLSPGPNSSGTNNFGSTGKVPVPTVPGPGVPALGVPEPQRPTPRTPTAPAAPSPQMPLAQPQGKGIEGQQTVSVPAEAEAQGQPTAQSATAPPQRPSVEMMAGQMLMVGFTSAELKNNAPVLELAAQGRIGGVLLLSRDRSGVRNIVSPSQVRVLTATLQKAAREGMGTSKGTGKDWGTSKGGVPLFVAVEQEGGLAQALEPGQGFEGGPAAARLGQGSLEATGTAARRMGLEMAALGINFDFAPLADANVNPLSEDIGKKFRSFSPSPQRAGAHALAFGRGLAAAGVIPCLKYFPGTGSLVRGGVSQGDGLFGPADMAASWRPAELTPFREVLAANWPGAVQPALAYHRGMDSLYPATLSARILTDILREQLGFGGVIVSNDLEALGRFYPLEDAILLAVRAGADVLLLPAREGVVSTGAGAGAGAGSGLSPEKLLQGALPGVFSGGLPGVREGVGDGVGEGLGEGLGPLGPLGALFGVKPPERSGLVSDTAVRAHAVLVQLVREGRISQQRLQQSWQRITALKKQFLYAKNTENPVP